MQQKRSDLLIPGARAGLAAACALLFGLIAWEYGLGRTMPPLEGLLIDVIVASAAVLLLAIGVEVLEEEYLAGSMRRRTSRQLYWAPRLLGVLFCLFMSIFALDVFGMGLGFWQTLAALLIHLAPVLILLALLAAAWRWEWLGAVGFGLFALWYLAMVFPNLYFPSLLVTFVLLPLIIAALMALNWRYHDEVRGWPRATAA